MIRASRPVVAECAVRSATCAVREQELCAVRVLGARAKLARRRAHSEHSAPRTVLSGAPRTPHAAPSTCSARILIVRHYD